MLDPGRSVPPKLSFRDGLVRRFPDLLHGDALSVLAELAALDEDRRELMSARLRRRSQRARDGEPIGFLDGSSIVAGTGITVDAARAGRFEGAPVPRDLARQWIQGTGPATRPRATTEEGLRNVAYALLSGADGWMFDGEDALGQVGTMALDNQRNLKLAFDRSPLFLGVADQVSRDMNEWARGFLGREIVTDVNRQLEFTTRIFRPRGLHLDDRHVRHPGGEGLSASIVDLALYVAHNQRRLRDAGATIALYLPKIQTAAEAAFWEKLLVALEGRFGMASGTLRAYVLVEQLEACFQLMEIRAALGRHFVGFNTGRWDYINSVADAMAWDPGFLNPNIDSITMTFGYMRHYEDRVRRAVNTPDLNGHCALWQGGMEANIPVGSANGVANGMRRALAGAEREQREGASGKWVAHWKMVHLVRPVWEAAGQENQLGRSFPPLTYTENDARSLTLLEPGPRTVRTVKGARDLLSVALQYANAFAQGFQAAALKPADHFGDDDVLYLMEDMATGEIRMSILWEWTNKGAPFNESDPSSGVQAGDRLTAALFARLLDEEYAKLLAARDRDVHDDSKRTTLPIARALVEAYAGSAEKPPWFVDLLNLCLERHDLPTAKRRVAHYLSALVDDGHRLTANPDFSTPISDETHP